MNGEATTEPQAPVNRLCMNSHPSDTINSAQRVIEFLQDAIPNQLKEDNLEGAAEGIMFCLMMVGDALAHADAQVKARIGT